jgi:murein DD-endopeptidase MepM/ murein hydrolase activator NlpD
VFDLGDAEQRKRVHMLVLTHSSWGRTIVAGAFFGLIALVTGVAARPVDAAPCWFPPVTGRVTDPYREPPCIWCAGNRGLEYSVGSDAPVRAAASGHVEFVGTVVDVGYVVVRLPNGWRHTYGQLASTSKQLGEAVIAGTPVGRASGTFFFGLRIGDEYADPAAFIGELRGRPRLIPLDGSRARPAPPASPRCGSHGPAGHRAAPTQHSDERNAAIRAVGSSPGDPRTWR